METHDSVGSMTEAYAQKAVIIAREFKACLDYSENPLMELGGRRKRRWMVFHATHANGNSSWFLQTAAV
jgi:hypothetical protein